MEFVLANPRKSSRQKISSAFSISAFQLSLLNASTSQLLSASTSFENAWDVAMLYVL
jgi:hypothetical protein